MDTPARAGEGTFASLARANVYLSKPVSTPNVGHTNHKHDDFERESTDAVLIGAVSAIRMKDQTSIGINRAERPKCSGAEHGDLSRRIAGLNGTQLLAICLRYAIFQWSSFISFPVQASNIAASS